MSSEPLIRSSLFCLLTLAIGASRAGAELAKSSPFLPVPAPAAVAGPTAGAPLEYRGRVDLPGEGVKVRIYDPNRKIGAWLKVNERDPAYDFFVKQYDADRDTASVEYRGQTLVLAQREAKVASSGAMAMPAPVMQAAQTIMPAGPPMIQSTVAATPQTQLDSLAADLAQRRALRTQATPPVNQAQPVAPQVQSQPQNRSGSQPNQNAQSRGGPNRGGRAP